MMVNIVKQISLLILSVLFLTSCDVARIYSSATNGAVKTYIPKPVYQGKNTSAIYINGSVLIGEHEHSSQIPNDNKELYSVAIHKSKTTKYYNFYYGVGASYGVYYFKEGLKSLENISKIPNQFEYRQQIEPNSSKDFYNTNFNIGINFSRSRRTFDYRLLGIELGYHYEFGNYSKKLDALKEVYNNSTSILVFNEKSLLSLTFTSEIVWKINKNTSFSLGAFHGDFLTVQTEIPKNGASSFMGTFYSLQYKKYTISILTEVGSYADSYRFGLSYQLK